MAACQGTPTATQFTTTVSSSFAERTQYSTIYSTINGGAFLRPRQDLTDSVTPSPTSSSTASSTDGTFHVDEVLTIIQTITLTDTLFYTDTIPILTLYDSCSNSDLGITRTVTTSLTSSVNASASTSTSVSLPSDIVTDMTLPPDGKATTTSGGQIIVYSQYVTTVNGVETIYATPIQTLLNTSEGMLNDTQRTGVIAGAAVGAVFVLVALLGLLFYFRRTRQVRQRHLEEKRAKERPARHLLEDEADDFHFGGHGGPPMMAQHWESTSFASTGSSANAPRLLRARGSRTGSLFQEDVWPPPNEVMQDPLFTAHDLGSSISLAMGVPQDSTTPSRADVSQPGYEQPSPTQPISSADAHAFGSVPVGTISHPNQRSSAYDSIRSADSADYYYNGRSHSRAESAEPLLDDTGRGSVSPPPTTGRNLTVSPTNTMDRRARKSNLRTSYTVDGFQPNSVSPPRPGHLRPGTRDSLGSISSPGASPEEGVLNGRAEELPPLYHTIPRDAS